MTKMYEELIDQRINTENNINWKLKIQCGKKLKSQSDALLALAANYYQNLKETNEIITSTNRKNSKLNQKERHTS